MPKNWSENILPLLYDLKADLLDEVESIQNVIDLIRRRKSDELGERLPDKRYSEKLIGSSVDLFGLNWLGEDDPEGDSGYSENMSLREKTLYFLEKHGRFLHFREVAQFILQAEGKPITNDSLNKLSGSLSSATGPAKKRGDIVKIQIGASPTNTFWGFPEWISSDKKVLPGHEHNKKLKLNNRVLPRVEPTVK